jgi:hypothetical protein
MGSIRYQATTIFFFAASAFGVGIYLFILYLAYLTSVSAFIFTLLLPVLTQLYWIVKFASLTGIFNFLTLACIACIACAIVGFALQK